MMIFARVRTALQGNWLPTALLLFVIAAAPFPFGSTSKPAATFWCIPLSMAVMFLSLRGVRKGQFWILAGVALIGCGYGFVLHEQLSDHPWMAPFNPIWQKTSDLLGVPIAPSVSMVKNEAFFAIAAPLANLMSLLLGLVIGADREKARLILYVIALSGAVYALYGVLSYAIDPAMLLWRRREAYVGTVTGTFINRNTAAAYFGSCGLLWLLVVLQLLRRKARDRRIAWRMLLQNFAGLAPKELLPPFIGLFICLIAMFLTLSRGGVAISLLAMVIASTIYVKRDIGSKAGVWIAFAASSIIALALLEFLGGRVSNRFDAQGAVDAGRIEAWRSTLHIIADYPWMGTGMGTFIWSFPAYRSAEASMWGVWNAAHNTPLELASEVGLPLAGLVGLGWLIMFGILLKGALTRRRSAIVPLSALSVAGLALLHSMIDFTLQAPGYTVPFFALFGCGLAQSFSSDGRQSMTPGRPD